MAIKNKNLYAKEYNVIYETEFDRILKVITKYSAFINLGVFFSLVFVLNIAYVFVINSIVFMVLLLMSLLRVNKDEDYPVVGIYGSDEKYLFELGVAVTSIDDIPSPADVAKRWDWYVEQKILLYPILVTDKMILTHMFVVGTTGAGKTTFLVNILRQLLVLGGGVLAVDGKGDKDVYEAFYNTAVDCGREDDFLVLNFNVPEESNKFNPLLKGNADEVTDIIGNLLDTGGDNAFWAGRALAAMKALLSILIPLRDAGLLFSPDYKREPVLTFSLLNKWFDLTALRDLYFIIKNSNEKGILVAKEDIKGFDNSDLQKYFEINYDRLQAYLTSVSVNIREPSAKIAEGSSKQHGNSYLMWNEPLDLISGRFKAIFDTATPDLDMQDVITNGRIVYVLLPALKVDPRSLSSLGKIILSLLKNSISVLLGEKIAGSIEIRYQASAIRPRVPFWSVMDEYGAYAVEGFDNVLAQARSLKVSVAILVQEIASLKKSSENEAKRLLGNTGIKIFLKIEEQETIEEAIKMIGQAEQAVVRQSKEKSDAEDRSIEVQEKELLKVKDMKKMTSGHGYIMWAGEVMPALMKYYEPPIAPEIPEFSFVQKSISQNYEVDDFVKSKKTIVNLKVTENKNEELTQSINYLDAKYNLKLEIVAKTIEEVKKPLSIEKTDKNLKNLYEKLKEAQLRKPGKAQTSWQLDVKEVDSIVDAIKQNEKLKLLVS